MSVFACHSHQWGLPSGDQGMRSRSLDELQRQSWVLWHICDLCTETFTWCSQLWAYDIIEGYLKFLKSVLSLPSQSKSCVQHNEISCEIFSAIVKFPQWIQWGRFSAWRALPWQHGVDHSWGQGVPCSSPPPSPGIDPWPGSCGEWGSH